MMVNKFVNYLYYKTKQDRLQARTPIIDSSLDSYRSVCIIPFKLVYEEGKGIYVFENISREYKFSISGQIQHINIAPEGGSVLFILNDENPVPLEKDDILKVAVNGNNLILKSVFLEIFLLCPILKESKQF